MIPIFEEYQKQFLEFLILESAVGEMLARVSMFTEVKFLFKKKSDSTWREMHGTKSLDLIPDKDHPQDPGSFMHISVESIYDLQKKAWRRFDTDTVMRTFQYKDPKTNKWVTWYSTSGEPKFLRDEDDNFFLWNF